MIAYVETMELTEQTWILLKQYYHYSTTVLKSQHPCWLR